jgi:hypothetical protein
VRPNLKSPEKKKREEKRMNVKVRWLQASWAIRSRRGHGGPTGKQAAAQADRETSSSIQTVYSRVRYSKDNKNTPRSARQYKSGKGQWLGVAPV